MRITLVIIGVLVAAVAIAALVGWSLPVKHRASREATFAAPPATVYDAITRVEDYPAWRSKVKSVVVMPSTDKRSFRESGGNGDILYVIEEEDAPRRIVTRIADDKLPFGGTWTYELTPAGNGTTLRITEDGEVYNPIFRFMSRFVLGHTATIDAYLADLGKRLK
jgi:hypothetical protein